MQVLAPRCENDERTQQEEATGRSNKKEQEEGEIIDRITEMKNKDSL
jgi:hypothetical protein